MLMNYITVKSNHSVWTLWDNILNNLNKSTQKVILMIKKQIYEHTTCTTQLIIQSKHELEDTWTGIQYLNIHLQKQACHNKYTCWRQQRSTLWLHLYVSINSLTLLSKIIQKNVFFSINNVKHIIFGMDIFFIIIVFIEH